MFALGGRAFTKRLAQEPSISYDEAESLKIKYSEGKLGADVTAKIDQILHNDCLVWLGGVELSCEWNLPTMMFFRIKSCFAEADRRFPESKKP